MNHLIRLTLACCALLPAIAHAQSPAPVSAPATTPTLDPACDPILKASEARISQPRWKTETVLRNETKIETIKVINVFYASRDGKWAKQPANLDEQERQFVAQLRSGKVAISNCKDEGEEKIGEIDTNVISMHLQVGSGAGLDVRLNIGKKDGLPYAQSSTNTKTTYQYKNVFAPRLTK